MSNSSLPDIPSRFHIKRKIGQGAYGEVYLVKDTFNDNQKYAMKLVEKSRHESVVTSARLECSMLMSLQHPNIVSVCQNFETDSHIAMLLKYCPYGDLYNLTHQRHKTRKFTEVTASKICKQLLSGLRYIHSRGLVHGDLKPENILVKDIRTMEVCLTDFGLSQYRKRMTWLKKRCGSPLFMAPEKFYHRTTEASDLWAIGIITYEMVFGNVPYEGRNAKHQKQILKQPFQNFVREEAGPWFPKDILSEDARDFIFLMLQQDPADRPTAVEALSHPWILEPNDQEIPPALMESLLEGRKMNHFQQIMSKLMIQSLRPDELLSLHEKFETLDRTKDGRISFEAFKSAFADQEEMSSYKVNSIFNSLDLHDRGTISYEQILAEVAYHHISSQDDRIMEFYEQCEEEGNITIQTILNLKPEEDTKTPTSFRNQSLADAWKQILGSNDAINRADLHKLLFVEHDEIDNTSDDVDSLYSDEEPRTLCRHDSQSIP